jgi:arylsulfatase A-like enzyme
MITRTLQIIVTVALAAPLQLLAQDTAKPNIIVIFTDDQGYGDLSCYDNPGDIKTPNIDRLASDGVRLTDGYSSAAVCGPSRCGLMSGRYQQRFGVAHNKDIFHQGFVKQTTLPQVLNESGYVTGMIGKWHLGRKTKDRWPNNRGFDEFYGFLMSARTYFGQRSNNPIMRNEEIVGADEGYLTDSFNREAVSFINKHAGKKPFFLYLSYNAPHYPLLAREDYLKEFNTGDKKRDTYLAMMKSVDEGVGMVLDSIKEKGIYDNTLVFFLSDNGGETGYGGNNGPLRSDKGNMFEGGIRVPFIVSWPGKIPKAKVCKVPMMSFDIFPTAVAAAGAKMPAKRTYDSRDMLPILTGKSKGPLHEMLFWQSREHDKWAIRKGNWKLVSQKKEGVMLFDLSKDLGEAHDLAAAHPEKMKELSELHEAWKKEVEQEAKALLGDDYREKEKKKNKK